MLRDSAVPQSSRLFLLVGCVCVLHWPPLSCLTTLPAAPGIHLQNSHRLMHCQYVRTLPAHYIMVHCHRDSGLPVMASAIVSPGRHLQWPSLVALA